MACLYTPSHIIRRLTGRRFTIGVTPRRMASFYNADVAGLTDAQVEFRNAVSEFAHVRLRPWQQTLTSLIVLLWYA
ncbi:hypothetical protein BGW80DRAFT_1288916, partial [Lactifluus volemus]